MALGAIRLVPDQPERRVKTAGSTRCILDRSPSSILPITTTTDLVLSASHHVSALLKQFLSFDLTMADYSFGGSDEENAELKKLNTEVVGNPLLLC